MENIYFFKKKKRRIKKKKKKKTELQNDSITEDKT